MLLLVVSPLLKSVAHLGRKQGTFSKDKNEILFSQFGINYNTLPAMFRKGSILVRERVEGDEEGRPDREGGRKQEESTKFVIYSLHFGVETPYH